MSGDAREWVLHPETEYRFELDPGSSIAIKLVRGLAEVFGSELIEGKTYVFGHECKAAVFTWQGCTIEVIGQPSTEYVSSESPMAAYANVHHAFEEMRVRALAAIHGSPIQEYDYTNTRKTSNPPRVLIVGPENSGKTTLCKILTNYAVNVNQGWVPVLINLDTADGAFAAPGAIAAAPVSHPIGTSTATYPLGAPASSRPLHSQSNALLPLCYWYGHPAMQRNPLLLERIIRRLGENINDRWDYDAEGKASGLIIDTPASFASSKPGGKGPDHRINILKACVDAFGVNVILVVGHEKLDMEMQRLFGERCTVVKVPKSGGVVELDQAFRERVQARKLHAYIYGEAITPPLGVASYLLGNEVLSEMGLSPTSSVIGFSDLAIYRIGEEVMAPSSALPIGAVRVVSEMQPLLVDPALPSSGLLNSVLAILGPPAEDEAERYDEEILDLHVLGFIVVTALDIPNRKLTILAPSAGSVARKTAIIGSFEWTDTA